MMKRNPSYYRARLKFLEHLIQSSTSKKGETANDIVLYRNGNLSRKADAETNIEHDSKNYSDEPLSFYEITRFNTWFALHPEKICGKEVISTSREFPITIQGKKEDILRIIGNKKQSETELELEAQALELELAIAQF